MGPALITPPAPISSPSGKFPFGWGQTGRLEDSLGVEGGGGGGSLWGKCHLIFQPHFFQQTKGNDLLSLPFSLGQSSHPGRAPSSNWTTEAGPGPSLVWKMQLPEEYRKVEGPAGRATRTAARSGRTPRTPQKLTNRKETPK